MTEQEWLKQLAILCLRWPQSADKINDQVADLWFMDLSEFECEKVEAAITALYRDGREFAPNGAQIRNKIIELQSDDGGWARAWNLILDACTSHGGAEYGGWTWLKDQDVLAAEAVGEGAWRNFCLSDDSMTTKESQVRRRWEELKGSADRHERYRGIPSAGLRALEGSGPRRFGELVQIEEEAA